MALKVHLCDDQSLVRSGFRMLIDSEDDMEISSESSNGQEALRALAADPADVVLMDIRMPEMDGVEATRMITEMGLKTKVLILTTFDLDEYVFAALKAGAAGFLLKDAKPEDLLEAIRIVASGESVVAPSATRRLIEHVAPTLQLDPENQVLDPRLDLLTEREKEVLAQIARGATNAEICQNLFMAEGTVKTHVGRLLSKLQCRDRVSLVLFAFESGFAKID